MRHSTFWLFVSAIRLTACAADPPGTLVEGSVTLTRSDGLKSGQTGFTFPDRTLLGEGAFLGSCTIERGQGTSRLTLAIERERADDLGLASFALEAPIESELQGSAQVSTQAAGKTASGNCAIEFSEIGEISGQVGFDLECEALDGDDGLQVGLEARLNIDFCDVVEISVQE